MWNVYHDLQILINNIYYTRQFRVVLMQIHNQFALEGCKDKWHYFSEDDHLNTIRRTYSLLCHTDNIDSSDRKNFD
jgi:hypothetical protein